jgi:hypothetical protein
MWDYTDAGFSCTSDLVIFVNFIHSYLKNVLSTKTILMEQQKSQLSSYLFFINSYSNTTQFKDYDMDRVCSMHWTEVNTGFW